MKHLYNINQTLQQPISYKTFCIPEIIKKINLEAVFYNWITHKRGGSLRFFSYCDYPFVFEAPTKARMLNMEARLSMVAATDRAHENTMLDWLINRQFNAIPSESPYLKLTVRRDKLIQDTLTCLAIAKPSDFRKLLRVEFDGEEAVDEGGVLKEFFLLIMRDLLSPIYGMFRCYPESRMLWFSESTMESENVFQLIGILCGLAIYNAVIVDLSFPLAMFRKLLGEKPELDDLKELDPVVGRSLQQLLDYEEPDFTDVFCSLTFSLDIDFFGANRHVDLIENGANITVNQENKGLYVEKYVDYVFNRSCEKPYKAFEGGFMQVCSGEVIHFFRPMELQSLVVGLEVINWTELRENTSYQGVYWDRHPVIEWFWEVLLIEFSIEDKKKFLRFLTGCDRVPIVGFSSLKITIQPNNSGDDYLPVAHTCANLLDLPLYSSKEILSQKLAVAVQQTEGFGLV
ncbi:HECT and RLD domain containing E3 ubiquitin protein ligase 4 [Fasciolopsis buskii]|uniref:HECT-type E3 ubiquitin transferase n=1 Tax=Fasciolopsis buskii TaxID=27845 RepID=A0A8E0RX14_9TREM|nr:HECT and RLD domain containing E3 ubiquitin protein ligase 4 [Fasciolopsis buski]